MKWRATGSGPKCGHPMTTQYTTEKAVHKELNSFYVWAETAKWYFRKSKTSRHDGRYQIPRDEVICSLVRKLVSTQEAIYKLCEAGLCNDALALSRIAFENAVTLAARGGMASV